MYYVFTEILYEYTQVHMHNLGHISAVWGGAGHSRVSGEADLVVDHNVDGPISGVVW